MKYFVIDDLGYDGKDVSVFDNRSEAIDHVNRISNGLKFDSIIDDVKVIKGEEITLEVKEVVKIIGFKGAN